MAYSDDPQNRVVERPVPVATTEYHDRVRWGPIFAGLVVAISTQLVLSGLGAAIGLTGVANSGAPRTDVLNSGTAVGIWSIISLLIALFLGGWLTSRSCGRMNRSTALLNGAILWATTLVISAWLLSSGISGAFGIVASNAGEVLNQVQQPGGPALPADPGAVAPNITAEEARNLAESAARAGWAFALGSLLGLVATLIGASVGVRKPPTTAAYVEDRPYAR